MKIGYDVNCLGENRITGVGKTALRLYRELQKNSRIEPMPMMKISRWRNKARAEDRLGHSVQFHSPWRGRMIDVLHGPDFRVPRDGSFAKVVTVHDLSVFHDDYGDPKFLRDSRRKTVTTILHSGVDHIIAISEFTKKEILHFFPNLDVPVTVIHHGVDFPDAERSEVLSAPERTPYFLFVGTNERRKNLGRTIDAFKSSGLIERGFRLKVVGTEGFGAADELQGRSFAAVDLLGFVDGVELEELYRFATAFVFPSLYEGFGLSILEAMSFGRPVITSRVGACADIAGGAALLVDPRNVREIAEAMNSIATSLDLSSALSEKGRRRVKDFSWTQAAQSTFEVYEQAYIASSCRLMAQKGRPFFLRPI